MQKSARILGHALGLSSQDFNWLLAEQGFIEGKPGAWEPTAKGLEFIVQKHEHRGTGGYAHYNRDWTETTWPEDIMDVLDLSPDRLEGAKEATRVHRATVREARLLDTEPYPISPGADAPEVDADSAWATGIDARSVVIVVAVVAGVALTTYLVIKHVPPVRRRWDERVAPRLAKWTERWQGQRSEDYKEPAADPR